MANNGPTQRERLASVEAKLEALNKAVENNAYYIEKNGEKEDELLSIMLERFDALDTKWSNKFSELEEAVEEDIRNLDKIKNTGRGVAIGLGLFFTSLGAGIVGIWERVTTAIFS